ncbi:helix-turn-helix domain-containing protein [Caulobacter sp. S45]|uniref:winged helix-turn-helix transcriptional regulator n=1 Tax=Caulobacter sp. S45 TaxID=1641861 RepID=UPI00131CD289|nr:helix-turn-helix domain-containing protein [Caulobacter sp. S45]
MRRKSFEGDACPIARSLDAVGDWWSLLIVREALAGVTRFSGFQRNLGAARNILAARLRTLVAQGILTTASGPGDNAHQDYLLTDKGRALLPVLVALAQWGKSNLFEPGETCLEPLDAQGNPRQRPKPQRPSPKALAKVRFPVNSQ